MNVGPSIYMKQDLKLYHWHAKLRLSQTFCMNTNNPLTNNIYAFATSHVCRHTGQRNGGATAENMHAQEHLNASIYMILCIPHL